MRGGRALLLCVICSALAAGCGERGISKNPSTGPSGAQMWTSFNEGMAHAAKEKKHVIIDFYASWCHWCKVMDRETFSDPDVKKYLAENFVTIRIDGEDRSQKLNYKGEEYTPLTLGRKFGVRAFPCVAYLDREGEFVTVVPGFVPSKTFLPLLRYMRQECYRQRMTFDEFMRRKGNCDSTESL